MNEALEAFGGCNYERAISLFEEASVLDPDNDEIKDALEMARVASQSLHSQQTAQDAAARAQAAQVIHLQIFCTVYV